MIPPCGRSARADFTITEDSTVPSTGLVAIVVKDKYTLSSTMGELHLSALPLPHGREAGRSNAHALQQLWLCLKMNGTSSTATSSWLFSRRCLLRLIGVCTCVPATVGVGVGVYTSILHTEWACR